MLTQNLPSTATEYSSAQRLEQQAAVAAVLRQWAQMGPDFDVSWSQIAPTVAAIVATAQARVVASSSAYVPAILEATGQTAAIAAAAQVNLDAFVGVTGTGASVAETLALAPIRAKQAVDAGTPERVALDTAGRWLSGTVGTILSDTGRGVESTEMYVRPVGGYVRMLTPPSCARCVILAGRWYRKNQGFRRHPECFPAGVVVSGPRADAATRRWYEGELTTITTASGKKLPATGNHPILTDRGWVPANLIQEGDHVVRSLPGEGAIPLVVPDENQVPTAIENLWRADDMVSFGRVPTSPEDFHGDGGYGEVDIVFVDRLLRDRGQAPDLKRVEHELFARRLADSLGLSRDGTGEKLLARVSSSPDGIVRGGSLGDPFFGSHLGGAYQSGLARPTHANTGLLEARSDGVSGYAEALADAVLAFPVLIGADDLLDVNGEDSPRWDAPAVPFSMESRGAYARRGEDLYLRLSGQVAVDRVVKVERVEWSGHVYNLSSVEGWFSANGLIVSNCDCRHIPASEAVGDDIRINPNDYFDSLDEAGKLKLAGSKSNLRAIEDGADLMQIVNAYRKTAGMQFAQVSPIKVDRFGDKFTTEGTTRRGLAGQQQAGLRRNGRSRARLMPESIYRNAASQEDALRLLRLYGWISDPEGQSRGRDILTEQRRVERNARARARRAERR